MGIGGGGGGGGGSGDGGGGVRFSNVIDRDAAKPSTKCDAMDVLSKFPYCYCLRACLVALCLRLFVWWIGIFCPYTHPPPPPTLLLLTRPGRVCPHGRRRRRRARREGERGDRFPPGIPRLNIPFKHPAQDPPGAPFTVIIFRHSA